MDHDRIVEHLLARGKCFLKTIVQASDLHHVAAASLANFAQMRPVARDILQAKIALEAQQRQGTAVARCGQEASVTMAPPGFGPWPTPTFRGCSRRWMMSI
jgi:hypothetical protein